MTMFVFEWHDFAGIVLSLRLETASRNPLGEFLVITKLIWVAIPGLYRTLPHQRFCDIFS